MALYLFGSGLAIGPVDNLRRRAILPTAEKSGIVDNVCNLLMRLKIPLMGTEVISQAPYEQWALCLIWGRIDCYIPHQGK